MCNYLVITDHCLAGVNASQMTDTSVGGYIKTPGGLDSLVAIDDRYLRWRLHQNKNGLPSAMVRPMTDTSVGGYIKTWISCVVPFAVDDRYLRWRLHQNAGGFHTPLIWDDRYLRWRLHQNSFRSRL